MIHCEETDPHTMDEMRSIQAILPAAVADVVRRAPMSPEKLAFAWKAAAGAAIDRATAVRLGQDGTVEVRVESDAWRRELNRSAKLLLDRLGDWLGQGVVSKLTVIGPPAERPRRRTSGKAGRDGASERTTERKKLPTGAGRRKAR